jgi:hypothetical protein
VDIDREKAHAMSAAMDDVLGRVKLTIAKGEDAERLRRAVSSAVDKAETIDPAIHKIASEIRAAIRPEGRSVQAGNAGRQLSEYILQQVLPASANRSLFDRIEDAIPLPSADRIDNLRESPATKWMNGYFHLLRLLGNETSHHKESNRVPEAIEDKDLMVIMFAIERVLGFWIAWRTQQAATAALRPLLAGSLSKEGRL